MKIYHKYFSGKYTELALVSLLLLFFFELLSDFIEIVYTQCLLTSSLNENILSVLLFFSPIILLFFRKRKNLPDWAIIIIGETIIICRVLEAILILQLKMIISGLGVACFLIYFPVFFLQKERGYEEQTGLTLGIGLAVALSLSILFRTLGSSLDLSTYG
ncbi:MAG: hypothetical protein ACFFBD_21580, partial [Candidatus Hodarchaeota archaeon]